MGKRLPKIKLLSTFQKAFITSLLGTVVFIFIPIRVFLRSFPLPTLLQRQVIDKAHRLTSTLFLIYIILKDLQRDTRTKRLRCYAAKQSHHHLAKNYCLTVSIRKRLTVLYILEALTTFSLSTIFIRTEVEVLHVVQPVLHSPTPPPTAPLEKLHLHCIKNTPKAHNFRKP